MTKIKPYERVGSLYSKAPRGRKRIAKHYDFVVVLDEFVAYKQRKGMAHQTSKNLSTLANRIKDCLAETQQRDMAVQELNLRFCERLEYFFESKGLGQNQISRIIGLVKKVSKRAVLLGIMEHTPLEQLKTHTETNYNTAHLKEGQIEKIANLLIENIHSGPKARDLLLFMTGSGCDFCDLKHLRNEQLHTDLQTGYSLHYARAKYMSRGKKAPQAVAVLATWAVRLLERYEYSVERLWSENKMSLQEFNRAIKELCKPIGLDFKMCSKNCRKSYAHYWQSEKLLSDETTAAMLGHVDTRHLRHYRTNGIERIKNEFSKLNIASNKV